MSVGSVFGYWLGWRGSRLLIAKETGALALARRLSERHGAAAVAICRPNPVLAEVSAIYLGMSGMPLPRYLSVRAASNLAISAAFAATGAWSVSFDSVIFLVLVSASLPALLWFVWWMMSRASGAGSRDRAHRISGRD